MAIIEADLNTPHHLQEVADILTGAKKIVVITGAGISTNSGIPVSNTPRSERDDANLILQDFRSTNGLYSLIETQHTDFHGSSVSAAAHKVKGKDLFDSAIWRDEQSTSTFYTFIASLRRKIQKEVQGTTATHKFIRQLRDQRKLVRCYTQNIDGLEGREGLITDLGRGKGIRTRFTKNAVNLPHSPVNSWPGNKLDGGCEVIQLHGDLESLRCTICSETFVWDVQNWEVLLLEGNAPNCPKCAGKNQTREDKGMRSTTVGTLRPNIVLYGEQHPSAEELGAIIESDLTLNPEVVLILGTSLKVNGLQVVVREFARSVHAKSGKRRKVIFVNHTKPPGGIWREFIDYHIAMDCDQWVQDALMRRADLGQTQSNLAKKLLHTRKPSFKISALQTPASASAANKKGIVAAPSIQQTPVGYTDPKTSVEPQHALGSALETDNTENPSSIIRTPSKSRQLPTPPSSREHQKVICSTHRYPPGNSDDDIATASPAKRRKIDIKIWEDEDSDTIHPLTPRSDSTRRLLPQNAASVNRLRSGRHGSTISARAMAKMQEVEVEPKEVSVQAIDKASVENDESCGFGRSTSPSLEVPLSTLAPCPSFVEVAKPKNPSVAQSSTSGTRRKRKRDCAVS
ncbi:hypothetical protein MMC26_001524 [Xylographa opegraphella]|nr:hypothetical protein [Xylographa opegraphella]